MKKSSQYTQKPKLSSHSQSNTENPASYQTLALHYVKGVKYLGEKKIISAEKEFIQVIRPILCKPNQRDKKYKLEECKDVVLDTMFRLGQIYTLNYTYENHHAKAAAIYQYCTGFARKYKVRDWQNKEKEYLKQAYLIEKKFLKSVGVDPDNELSFTDHHKKIQLYKSDLENHRAIIRSQLDDLQNFQINRIKERTQEVENIYNRCTKFFVNNGKDKVENLGLIQKLLQECYLQLGAAPEGCTFTVIGLGSIAGGKMTPYSDIELAILVNENKPEYKEYLRNLTKLLNIKTVNLGESMIRQMGIDGLSNQKTGKPEDDWFWDEVIDGGIRFDSKHPLGCKSPLGRQGYKNHRDYELILTPREMAAFQEAEPKWYEQELRNAGNKLMSYFSKTTNYISNRDISKQKYWWNTDDHLVQALRNTVLIDGSQKLLDRYRYLKKKEISSEIVKARALKILLEDVNKFELKFGFFAKEYGEWIDGKMYNIKQDIYRLGDRIIDALADYFLVLPELRCPGLTSWQKIDILRDKGKLNPAGAQRLKEALSIATELRMRVYCNNKAQQELFTTFKTVNMKAVLDKEKKEEEESDGTGPATYEDTSLLHHFYYVMCPLQFACKEFKNKISFGELMLVKSNLYTQEPYFIGVIHARFLEYELALEYLMKCYKDQPDNIVFAEELWHLCMRLGKHDITEEIAKKLNKTALTRDNPADAEYSEDESAYDVFGSYVNLGNALSNAGKFREAEKAMQTALSKATAMYSYKSNHPLLACTYGNLGELYRQWGKYDLALKNLCIAAEMYKNTKVEYDLGMSARIYLSIGGVYLGKAQAGFANHANDLKMGEHYTKQALEIANRAYSLIPNHHVVLNCYNILGNLYLLGHKYNEAIFIFKKCIEGANNACGGIKSTTELFMYHMNVGVGYLGAGKVKDAQKYLENALRIGKVVYKDYLLHPGLGKLYMGLAQVYFAQNQILKAYYCSEKALNIFKSENNSNTQLNFGIKVLQSIIAQTVGSINKEDLVNLDILGDDDNSEV